MTQSGVPISITTHSGRPDPTVRAAWPVAEREFLAEEQRARRPGVPPEGLRAGDPGRRPGSAAHGTGIRNDGVPA